MIRGAIFTIGLLTFLGFGAFYILVFFAAGMSDSVSAGNSFFLKTV